VACVVKIHAILGEEWLQLLTNADHEVSHCLAAFVIGITSTNNTRVINEYSQECATIEQNTHWT